jgi:hypothetical protein
VIKNPEDAKRVYTGKRDQIDTIKEGTIKFQEKHPADSNIEEENIPEPISQPKTQERRKVEPR